MASLLLPRQSCPTRRALAPAWSPSSSPGAPPAAPTRWGSCATSSKTWRRRSDGTSPSTSSAGPRRGASTRACWPPTPTARPSARRCSRRAGRSSASRTSCVRSTAELFRLGGRLLGRAAVDEAGPAGRPAWRHLRSDGRRGDRARRHSVRSHRRPHASWPALRPVDLDDARGERADRGLRSARAGRRPSLGPRSDDGGATHPHRAQHVLASAAVPLLFPAVEIDGQFYCDGGLRQNVPLSPARRLGADRLVVINPRFIREEAPTLAEAHARERVVPDPLFVAGKAMNALAARPHRERHRPPAAAQQRAGRGHRPLRTGLRRCDQRRAHEEGRRQAATSRRRLHPRLDRHRRARGRLRAVRALREARGRADGADLRRINDAESEADLLSYVLFDGEFAAASSRWAAPTPPSVATSS